MNRGYLTTGISGCRVMASLTMAPRMLQRPGRRFFPAGPWQVVAV